MWGAGDFDFCHTPPTLALAHPNPSTSVNELEDPGAIEGSVQLVESLSASEGLVEVVLLHPPRKWVVLLCWGCGEMALTSLCSF